MLDYKVSYHYSTAAVSEELPYCFLKSPFSSQYKSISWGKQIFATRSDEDEIEKPFICKKRGLRITQARNMSLGKKSGYEWESK